MIPLMLLRRLFGRRKTRTGRLVDLVTLAGALRALRNRRRRARDRRAPIAAAAVAGTAFALVAGRFLRQRRARDADVEYPGRNGSGSLDVDAPNESAPGHEFPATVGAGAAR
jgi:hypothetical protein